MFPKDAAGAVERNGVDTTVQERETEANNAQVVPEVVVVVLCCWAGRKSNSLLPERATQMKRNALAFVLDVEVWTAII